MPTVLDGIQLKLVRAQKHVDELRDTVRAAKGGQGHEIVGRVDPKRPHEIVLTARIAKPPDPYWAAVLGDVIQNCRAVLDHIFTALVDAAGGDSRRVYFPIYGAPGKFKKYAIPQLLRYGIPDSQRTLIESLQPYSGTTRDATQHPAWVVYSLAKIDKHRALATQHVAQTILNIRVHIDGHVIDVPPNNQLLVLHDGAELARLAFHQEGTRDVRVQGRLQTRLFVEEKWPLILASEGVLGWVRDDVVPRFAPSLRRL